MSTSLPRNVVAEPPAYYWSNVMYTALTSTVYTVVAVAIIILLLFVLVGLIFLYVTRVRSKKYSSDDVKYSPVNQDPDDQMEPTGKGSTGKKKKESKSGGLFKRSNPVMYPAQHSSTGKQGTVAASPYSRSDVSLLLDYLENQLDLEKEWNELCTYSPDPMTKNDGRKEENRAKNRTKHVPYDRKRVKLDSGSSRYSSDYINASFIVDAKVPLYIATQCPKENTVDDFWQMVWERDVFAIVNLTTQEDIAAGRASPYWPEEGIQKVVHNFEINFHSAHRSSEDIIVRSFILINTGLNNKSRTVTLCQYTKWEEDSVPDAKSLLDFRRIVLRAQRNTLPLLVHCSDGVGRTGTYILIDLELNRLQKLQKGAKQLNPAGTIEHLRDNCPDMVATKEQFEFALRVLVEEIKDGSEGISQKH